MPAGRVWLLQVHQNLYLFIFFISSFKLSGLVVLVFLPDEVGRSPELLKVRFARLLYLFNALVVVPAKKIK